MLNPNGNKKMVSVILTEDLKTFAEAEAARLGLNLSAYIRYLIAQARDAQK